MSKRRRGQSGGWRRKARRKTKHVKQGDLDGIPVGVQSSKHSHRYTFSDLDGWIRMRPRSILRKRLGKEGCGRGSDHQRWPNKFFAVQGLYRLKTAHALACQS